MLRPKKEEKIWIRKLIAEEGEKEDAILAIYKEFQEIANNFLKKRGASPAQQQDLYHQAILILIHKDPEILKGIGSLKQYILGICKFLLIKDNQLEEGLIGIEGLLEPPDDPQEISFETDNFAKKKALDALWNHLKKDCRKILEGVAKYGRRSYPKLSEIFNMPLQTLKNKGAKCKKQAKAFFTQHPHLLELFKS